MRDAVIVAAVRTPIGKKKGVLAGIHPVDLSAHVLNSLLERAGLDPALVDDVFWGCVTQAGEQSCNIGRNAVLAAGWPDTVPASTIDRQCGSSQQAVHSAAAAVISGQCDIAVAGGVESMTRVPMGSNFANGPGEPFGPQVAKRYPDIIFNQGLSAEMIAQRWRLSRAQLDEFSLRSHARAAAAQKDGVFDTEITPVPIDGGLVTKDQGVRPDTDLAALGTLTPVFKPDGVVTAGNSSQISDGAAALLVTTTEHAAAAGLHPMARIHTAVVAAADPVIMLTAPMPATEKALRRAGLTLDDVGVFEVNEAFAAIPLAWLADTGADASQMNPLGGAIALGHPLGGSGARLMTTLVYQMLREEIHYGLQTMCEGGGMANATILELA